MGEISDFKEKNVEVLVENYDIDKFEPDPFNYVIKTLSFDKLKEILTRMPVKAEPFKVRVRVITRDFIFLKHRFSKKTLYIRPNQVGNFFTQWKYELQASLWSRSVPLKKIHKVDPYLSGEADLSFWYSFIAFFFVTAVILLLPILNLFTFIWNFDLILNLGFQVWLISGILLLSSCIVIGKIFYEGLKAYFLKKRCIIDIDNYIPYLSNFKTIDFDYPLLVGGQIFYFIIFALYSFNLPLVFRFFTAGAPAGRMLFIYVISEGDFLTIILYFLMILSIVLFLYILIGTFITLYKNYHMKDSMIEFLPSKLNLNDEIERIYYLQLYNLIKTKKLWEVGLIAKITTIFSVASTLFPLIQNIVIS